MHTSSDSTVLKTFAFWYWCVFYYWHWQMHTVITTIDVRLLVYCTTDTFPRTGGMAWRLTVLLKLFCIIFWFIIELIEWELPDQVLSFQSHVVQHFTVECGPPISCAAVWYIWPFMYECMSVSAHTDKGTPWPVQGMEAPLRTKASSKLCCHIWWAGLHFPGPLVVCLVYYLSEVISCILHCDLPFFSAL